MKILIALLLSLSLGFAKDEQSLYFGVTAVALTKDTTKIFKFIDYLSHHSGINITPKFAKNYDEIKLMLETEDVDFAYVCGATYVQARANLEILAFPYFDNEPLYYSLVIARSDSDIEKFLDFEGKNYAFSDPRSNSGSLVPMCYLRNLGENYREFFANIIYTYDHSYSIEAVLDGYVDGASIDSLIFESYKLQKPEAVQKIKVVQKIGPYQTTPFVIRSNISKAIKKRLLDAFRAFSDSDEGLAILKSFGVDKFDYTDEYDYSSVESMVRCSNTDD